MDALVEAIDRADSDLCDLRDAVEAAPPGLDRVLRAEVLSLSARLAGRLNALLHRVMPVADSEGRCGSIPSRAAWKNIDGSDRLLWAEDGTVYYSNGRSPLKAVGRAETLEEARRWTKSFPGRWRAQKVNTRPDYREAA